MSKVINFSLELNRNYFPANGGPQTIYGLIRIKPEENSIKGRMELDLRLLLDRSTSMNDTAIKNKSVKKTILDALLQQILKKNKTLTKMDILKVAVNKLVDELCINDMLSIITFDSSSQEIVSKIIKQDSDKDRIKTKVSKIEPRGCTNLSKSLKRALNYRDINGGTIKRILIFTDGEVNTPSPNSEEKDCLILSREAKKLKIPFILFGTGITYNDKFLEQMADITGGRMEHVSDPASVIDIFNEEIGFLGDIAITNMEAGLETEHNVILKEVSRVVPHITSINISSQNYVFIPLGDLDRARGQAILFQAEIPDLPEGKHKIGSLEVIYDIPLQSLIGEKREFKIEIDCVKDTSLCKENNDVLTTVQLAGASKLQTLAMEKADSGDTLSATRLMNHVHTIYTKLGENDLATKVKTLTNAIGTKNSNSGTTKDVRRTLTTQARASVSRTLTRK